jgi:predicted transcriptional regulator
MKEILTLNQVKSVEFGFKNIQSVVIFTAIADLIEKNKDGVELKEIVKQLPLLDLETDTINRYIIKLEKEHNLIVRQKTIGKKHIIELTELGKKYFEVKEKNPDNEISSLVDNIIGVIAKKFFLLSDVLEKNPDKYDEEWDSLIISLVNSGIYSLYFEKLRSFIDKKYYSCKYNNVEIDPFLELFRNFIDVYAKDSELFRVVGHCGNSSKSNQSKPDHTIEMMCMFYREKYLNREI